MLSIAKKNTIEQRDRFPESYFWETEEGIGFLSRLFVGVLFLFGIKSGIGAGTISEFFKLLRIDTHVGSSPTTIKNYMNKIQDMLEEYLKSQESKQVSAKSLKIVGGADETFFDNMLIVFMSYGHKAGQLTKALVPTLCVRQDEAIVRDRCKKKRTHTALRLHPQKGGFHHEPSTLSTAYERHCTMGMLENV